VNIHISRAISALAGDRQREQHQLSVLLRKAGKNKLLRDQVFDLKIKGLKQYEDDVTFLMSLDINIFITYI
jgi:hypothetical protein